MQSPALLVSAVLALAAMPAAQARLGETRQQCVERYGDVVAEVPALLEQASGVTFSKGEIRIRVEFLGDKASFISFSRRGLKDDDRQMLLEVNSGPLAWNPPAEFLGRLCWTAPGNAGEAPRHAASYVMGDSVHLDVATDEWARAMKAQQAVQFAIQPRPATPAPAPGSGGSAPVRPIPSGKLEGF